MPYRLAIAHQGGYWDSNPGPSEPQSDALTNCAIPTIIVSGGIRTPDPRLRRPLLYPTELLTHNQMVLKRTPAEQSVSAGVSRGDKIRTCDLPVPNRTLYQTEPRPEAFCTLSCALDNITTEKAVCQAFSVKYFNFFLSLSRAVLRPAFPSRSPPAWQNRLHH